MARIHKSMRIAAYNDRSFFDSLDVLIGCYYILAANTGRQVSVQIEDLATSYTAVAMQYTYEVAGDDWQDFCRVEHGAQGAWASVGSGKWDAAIAKYGPTPAPTTSEAENATAAIYEALRGATGSLPSDKTIRLGCNKLLFGGGTGVIAPGKKAEDEMGWIMHDRILEAAGRDWPDFCRSLKD